MHVSTDTSHTHILSVCVSVCVHVSTDTSHMHARPTSPAHTVCVCDIDMDIDLDIDLDLDIDTNMGIKQIGQTLK